MNFSEIFVRRPVMTTLVMATMLIFGILAYIYLPVADLPNVDRATIQVRAGLPGATPETMATSVATPLEKEFSTIAGLATMSSSSTQGSTSITLEFELTRNIDNAAQDVQAAISRALGRLPADMPSPPSFSKVNPADQPVIYYSVTSSTMPLAQLDEYAETTMAQRISTIDGVSLVAVYGAQKYAVRIQLDPEQLASRGLGLNDVTSAIQQANVNLPTGRLDGRYDASTVQATGQLYDAKAYDSIIIKPQGSNRVIRLSDVGRAIDSVENNKTGAWYIDRAEDPPIQRAIVVAVQRQPGTNTIAVVNRVKGMMETIRKELPASVRLNLLFDKSVSINESVHDVKLTLYIALGLVIGVIFLFLRSLRATVIPALAIPLSLVGTFAIMYFFGFSIDNLSLMAMTLSIGFVVDDAIVMLENCVRHMEMGKPRFRAVLDASREIGFTIISMTLSLTAVFIPFLFMPGIIGRLLHEFAVTIATAILLSGVVSLTLTPMLAARILRPHQKHGRLFNLFEKFFEGWLWLYEKILAGALRFHPVVTLISLVILVATGILFYQMPRSFIPTEDTGQLFGFTRGNQKASYDAMVEHQLALAEITEKNPFVERGMTAVGFGASNQGIMFLRLMPRGEPIAAAGGQPRPKAQAVLGGLVGKYMNVPGIMAFLQQPDTIQLSGRRSEGAYQYTLQGSNTKLLYSAALDMTNQIRQIPGTTNVISDLQLANPQALLEIDRDRARTLGISAMDIEQALSTAFASKQISNIYASTNTYEVLIELLPKYQERSADLGKLYLRSAAGDLVPLNTLVRTIKTVGPLTVNHQGQLPSVTITFGLDPTANVSLGTVTDKVDEIARTTLPPTITASFQGTAQIFQNAIYSLGALLIVSIVVIYIVLGILYESFIHPITILTALPFAAFGALVTLKIFGYDINLYSFVGIIMLVGLVKKNGIMMIDFALEKQRENPAIAPRDAIFEACLVRFRPIMMTTMAALLGTLPIALGLGAGAESRRPLGLAVVGGLLFSQALTLFVTPVFFVYFEKMRRFFGAKPAGVPTTPTDEEEALAEPQPVPA